MLSHLWLSGGTRSPLCTALAGLMSSPHLHEVGEIKHQERAFVVAGRGSLRLEHASLWLLPSLQIPTALILAVTLHMGFIDNHYRPNLFAMKQCA